MGRAQGVPDECAGLEGVRWQPGAQPEVWPAHSWLSPADGGSASTGRCGLRRALSVCMLCQGQCGCQHTAAAHNRIMPSNGPVPQLHCLQRCTISLVVLGPQAHRWFAVWGRWSAFFDQYHCHGGAGRGIPLEPAPCGHRPTDEAEDASQPGQQVILGLGRRKVGPGRCVLHHSPNTNQAADQPRTEVVQQSSSGLNIQLVVAGATVGLCHEPWRAPSDQNYTQVIQVKGNAHRCAHLLREETSTAPAKHTSTHTAAGTLKLVFFMLV